MVTRIGTALAVAGFSLALLGPSPAAAHIENQGPQSQRTEDYVPGSVQDACIWVARGGSDGLTLRKGSSDGFAVTAAQYLLSVASTPWSSPPINGIFGASTARAVRKFQTQEGLRRTGIISKATWNALWQEGCN